jgi:hypothetical protein
MSPAIAAIEEAGRWLGLKGEGGVLTPPESWEWVTVGVWTCKQSCGGGAAGGSGLLAEEHAVLCNE